MNHISSDSYVKNSCIYHKFESESNDKEKSSNDFIKKIKTKLFRIGQLIINKVF